MEGLTHEAFRQQAGTRFKVAVGEDRAVDLDLVEISDIKLYPGQEGFEIVFRGPLNAFLGQGVRPFTHAELGEFEAFIVPIRQDDQGFYYEAVFNRLRQ
jgi:hypothetical protein